MAQFNSKKSAFARERLTVTSGAVKTLTATVYNPTPASVPPQSGNNRYPASGARIVLSSASGDLHFNEEGTDPTTSVAVSGVGTVVGARDVIVLESYEAIVKFKAIALTATDAIIEVVYFR
jgi:hypothetical protein